MGRLISLFSLVNLGKLGFYTVVLGGVAMAIKCERDYNRRQDKIRELSEIVKKDKDNREFYKRLEQYVNPGEIIPGLRGSGLDNMLNIYRAEKK